MSIPPTPLIEHAKTGRANCRRCHQQIKKDELRIGLPAFYRGHITYRWFHPYCLPKWGMLDLDLEMINSDDDKTILEEIIKKRPSRIPLAAITAETDFLVTIEGRVEKIEPKKVFQKKTTEKGYLQAGVITDGQKQRRIIGWNQESDLIATLKIGTGYRFSYLQPVENRHGEIEFSLTRISQTEEIDFKPIKDIIAVKEVYISRSRTDKLYCLGCRRKISRGEFRIKKIDEKTEKGRFYHLGCIDPQYLLLRVKEYLEDEKSLIEDKLDLHRRTERVISHRDPNLLPAFLELEIKTDGTTPKSADLEN